MSDNPFDPKNKKDPSPFGMAGALLGSLVGTVTDINRSIRQDLRDMTPPETPATSTPATPPSGTLRPDIQRSIESARYGVASVDLGPEEESEPEPPAPTLPPTNPQAVNRTLSYLTDPAKHTQLIIDTYFHAYNPADIPAYNAAVTKESKPPFTFSLLTGEGRPGPLRTQILQAINANPRLFGSFGMGPRDMWDDIPAMEEELITLLNENPRLLAVGPVGLDMNFAPEKRAAQTKQMLSQLEIATEFGLPAFIFHRKGSLELRQELLAHANINLPLIFIKPIKDTDDRLLAESLGAYLLIRSEITFPEYSFYRETVQKWPRDKLLIGCGNALVAPITMSGQFNGPIALPHILKQTASLLQQEPRDTQRLLNQNAIRLFFKDLNPA